MDSKKTLQMLLGEKGAELVAEGTHFKQGDPESSLWGGKGGQRTWLKNEKKENFLKREKVLVKA